MNPLSSLGAAMPGPVAHRADASAEPASGAAPCAEAAHLTVCLPAGLLPEPLFPDLHTLRALPPEEPPQRPVTAAQLRPQPPLVPGARPDPAAPLGDRTFYTGLAPDGSEQTVAAFLASPPGRQALMQLLAAWDELLDRMRATPDERVDIRRRIEEVLKPSPPKSSAAAARLALQLACLLSTGKRSLDCLLLAWPRLAAPRQRDATRALFRLLGMPGADPSWCIGHVLTGLHAAQRPRGAARPASGPSAPDAAVLSAQNRALWEAVKEQLQTQTQTQGQGQPARHLAGQTLYAVDQLHQLWGFYASYDAPPTDPLQVFTPAQVAALARHVEIKPPRPQAPSILLGQRPGERPFPIAALEAEPLEEPPATLAPLGPLPDLIASVPPTAGSQRRPQPH